MTGGAEVHFLSQVALGTHSSPLTTLDSSIPCWNLNHPDRPPGYHMAGKGACEYGGYRIEI